MSSTDTAELGAAAAHATAPPVSEDWLSLAIGLVIFALALFSLWGVDLLGWVVSAAVWADPSLALAPFSKTYAELGGAGAFIVTYLALLAVLSAGAAALGADVRRFAVAFTAVFWIAHASWIVGNNAHLAAVTPADLQRFGIDWSLRLTNEGGYIVALLAGLVIANFFPRFADWIKEAVRPELYVKIAIVILGGFIAVQAAGRLNLATSLILRGIAAIAEAYLIYWAVVYYIARKWFGFSREWAAPLASGISICGVSAAIATGGAIRARPGACAGVIACRHLRRGGSARPAVPGPDFPVAGPAGRRRLDGACGQDRRRRHRRRRHHRGAHSLQGRCRRNSLSTGLDSRHDRDHQGVHRHLHRGLGLRARLYLDEPHQPDVRQGARRGDLASLPEIRPWFRTDLRGRAHVALAAPADIVSKLPAANGEANTFRVIFFILTFFSIGVL